MSHIKGEHDSDLHHADGSHRTTPPETKVLLEARSTVSGRLVKRHEERLRRHLLKHIERGLDVPSTDN